MGVLEVVALFVSGLLAGEEFIVRYGIQPALRSLDDRAHVAARVALVRALRVVVPILMLPAAALTFAVLAVDPSAWHWAAAVAALAILLFSFPGTVPINMKVIDWTPDAPPANWRAVVTRWERIDIFRSGAAVLTFALLLGAQL